MKKMILIVTIFISLLLTYSAKSQPVIADFQVNENATDRWSQGSPLVLVHGNNNYMIVWSDYRELVGVFAQVFSSDNTALGDNFYLEGAESTNQYGETFAAAADDNGNFIIVWRRGDRIFAQLFDSTGAAVGENFQVSDYVGITEESFPSAACGDSSSFIITWRDKRSDGRGDIYARRFASDGTPLGSDFKVSFGSGRQDQPDIKSNAGGEFVITWEDFRVDFNGGDVYAQQFDKYGNKVGTNIRVNTEYSGDPIRQTDPACSVNDSGKFVIVWNTKEWDHSNPDIYAQRFDWDGNRLGANFRITDDTYSLQYPSAKPPAVAINNNGNFFIAWTDSRNENEDIYVQHYSSDGTALGDNQKINDDEGDADQYPPDVAADHNSDFILTWLDLRDDGYGSDIYLQKFAGNGSLIGGNFHTTNEGTVMVSTNEGDPFIVIDNEGSFTIIWRDERDRPDIYAQRYESNGVPIDTNFRVNDDQKDTYQTAYWTGQYTPCAAVNDDGNLLIAWVDGRNGLYDQDIYAQLYSGNGAAMGSNFKVDDDTSGGTQSSQDIAATSEGNFIVVWRDTRNDNYDIYARRFDDSGVAIDSSFKVNDDEGSDSFPAIASNDSGKFLIAWTDNSHENASAIYAQLYTPQGAVLGTNFKISDNAGGEGLRNTAIATGGIGNFVIVWTDYTNKDIYAQRVTGDGTLIDSNFQVGPDGPQQWNPPAIAADNAGNFIITWSDGRNEVWPDVQVEVFAQRFNSEGTPIGTDFKVTGSDTVPYEYTTNVELFNNNIYTTWDERGRLGLGTGTDIWVNVLNWDNPVGIENDIIPVAPAVFTLNQNYPNPFNPVTTINYQLPITNYVELNIYNLLGQKITTLVSKHQQAGTYQVEWDAGGFPSGLYFYQIRTDNFVRTRRMLLLK